MSRTILAVVAAWFTSTAAAQCSFQWIPGAGFPGFNDSINSIVRWDPDGPGPLPEALVFGGRFTYSGDLPTGRVALWDGVSFQALGAGVWSAPPGSGIVETMTVLDGDLIVAGSFQNAGSGAARNIARWDGTQWSPLLDGVLSRANGMTVYNGDLIVVGEFTIASGVSANRIARWDGSNWSTFGTGFDNTAQSLAVYNGELYAGGLFTSAGGVAASRIARWNGSAWQAVGSGTSVLVRALTLFEGDLIAGGSFTTAGGESANRVARWNGVSWSAMGAGFDTDSVAALHVHAGELYAGRRFSSGLHSDLVARWDGGNWQTVGTLGGMNSSALGSHDGELVVGGNIRGAGGHAAANAATWDGANWLLLRESPGYLNSPVGALANYNGVVAGGNFTAGGSGPVDGIGRWDGAAWTPLQDGVDGTVNSLLVQNDALVAAGHFSTMGGVASDDIATWTDADAWQAMADGISGCPTQTCIDVVYGLTAYQGDLIAVGEFSSAGFVDANSIVRWDGTAWHAMGSGPTPPGGPSPSAPVYAATEWNGNLVVGGVFISFGGATALNVALWDGANWSPLGPGFTGTVRALIVYQDQLIVGGDFPGGVAIWDGASWTVPGGGLTASAGANVQALSIFDGRLIAGGSFSHAGDTPASNIAQWDGTIWSALGTGLDNDVLALLADGQTLWVGGYFILAGGQLSPNFARWTHTCAGDLDGNRTVDIADLARLLGNFGLAGGATCSDGDVDFSGGVDLADLAALLSAFGEPCP